MNVLNVFLNFMVYFISELKLKRIMNIYSLFVSFNTSLVMM